MANSNIPKGWAVTKLGAITNIATGKKDVNEGHEDGKYPFFTCSQKEYRINDPSFDTEAILVAGNAYFNVKYYKGKFDAYQRTYVIDGFKDNIGPYLYYVLSKDVVSLTTNNQGSAVKYIKLRDLTDFTVILPPSNERSKIIDILRMVDSVLVNTQAVIDQIQALKNGIIQELFTRGIPSRHKKFKMTDVGEIPDSWEVKPVKELISVCQYGLNKPLSTDPIGVPVLRMNNLGAGKIDVGDVKYAVLTKEEECEYLLEPGDVLFNRTNSRALVGKVAIYKERRKMSFASYLLRLKAKRGETDPRWLNYYFNTAETQNKLSHMATPGVSQSNINAQVMQSLRFKTPPIEEQKIMADLIDLMETRVEQEALVMDGYVQIKYAIMQILLTGKVRVKC